MNTPIRSTPLFRPAVTAVVVLALLAGSARADSALPPAAPTQAVVTPAFGGYWSGFVEHWGGVFKKQNGIIMAAMLLGAVSLFIITRGKWKK